MIGSLGSVVFVATADTLRTFDEFTRTSAGRWAKHEVLGRKPLSQHLGPGLDVITFNMRFDTRYGINPRKEMDELVSLERKGKAVPLTIGGKGLGVGLWVITSLALTYNIVDRAGNVVVGTAALTLEEYVVKKT